MTLDQIHDAISSTGKDLDLNLLPINCYVQLLNWLATRTDDIYFGLNLSEHVTLASFGGGASMVYHASSLKDCFECLAKYDQTISQGIEVNFVEEDGMGHLEYRLNLPASADLKHDHELTIALIVRFIRGYLGEEWFPEKVHFSHSRSEKLDEIQRFFGPNLFFEQATTGIWITNQDINYQITDTDPYLLEILRDHANRLQANATNDICIFAQARYYVARTIGTASCCATDAAVQLQISRRSLTRQLNTQNTSFRDLKKNVFEEAAKKALTETSSSISDIAMHLGYSETSAFDRSFKKLTGYTPSQYRKMNDLTT